MQNPRRTLVFTTNWLGDALFLSAFIANLKENFPQSYLAVLLVPRVKEIFLNNPHVDKIIIFNERGWLSFLSRLGLIFRLKKEAFDTAFIIKPSLSRAMVLKFAGVKKIVGFDNRKCGWLLDVKIPRPPGSLHKIDYFLSILEQMGLNRLNRRYEFFPSNEDRLYIERLFLEKKIARNLPLVVINPGANWYPKRWSPESFSELIRRLKESSPINIVITGAGNDRQLARRIINNSARQEVFDFTGQTTLGQLGALMKQACVVVTADSGPMHIAAAVGVRTIALFGPTSSFITGPYPSEKHIVIQKDVGCRVPCYDKNCQDYRCMKAITVQEVLGKVIALLAV